ncbi:tetratricopeptide repeat protein [Janthinobacterium sp.]|uniref:tetratricopeptide repeat protein n=1 Tax=Janthinobacterium sp. TaxID=1871054 RepID=UPI00293D2EC9|nr:tetratricopeptide repeat protein [Janthinobacterium sp.]
MNIVPIRLAAGLLLAAALSACNGPQVTAPTAALIEADAMRAGHAQDAAAERRVRDWAMRGLPVAERELGLLYRMRPAMRAQSMQLFEKSARAGDAEAAFQLGDMYRSGGAGLTVQPEKAAPWYRLAGAQKHAKAALALALMVKNGDGVPLDEAEAARWLALASEWGNPHAMFLLYNAYQNGLGLPRDAAKARHFLEEAAEHEYPPALQELAMAMQHGDALAPGDAVRAGHLMKEATEHRRNNWNRF